MPTVLTEAARRSSRRPVSESEPTTRKKGHDASSVLKTLEQHVLLDGFKIVVDLEKSRGSYLHNAVNDQRLIDLYGFFGSNPVGFNHPHFERPEVKADLLRGAQIKIANSDIYSEGYAEFVETFVRVAGLPPLESRPGDMWPIRQRCRSARVLSADRRRNPLGDARPGRPTPSFSSPA